jgi:hypothetical protein
MTQTPPARFGLRLVSRWLALAILAGSVVFWVAKGAHRGWSQNRVPVPQVDEITGIEYVTYEERFVPGVDWLVGGIGAAVVVFTGSFFFRSKPQHPTA